MNWFPLTLIAVTFYGLWGFVLKVGSNYLNPKSLLAYEMIGFLVGAIILLALNPLKLEYNTKGAWIGFIAGVLAAIATVALFIALSKERASITITLNALYPIVTIFLSVMILKETFSLKEGAGILMALIAMGLLAK